MSLAEHIKEGSLSHKFLAEVLRHESERIIRLEGELCTATNVYIEETPNPKKMSCEVRNSLKSEHMKMWKDKPQHGYLMKKQQGQVDYDKEATNAWLNDRFMSSHFEGFICAIQEQEIRTRLLINKRENPESNPKCRYCHVVDESIFHILNSCSHLSASMYLPIRHNEVAKVIYQELLRKFDITPDSISPESIVRNENAEIWWDKKIKVQPTVQYNRPDIVQWDLKKKKCTIIDICVPMDVNVKREENEKCDKYILLASRLKRLYPEYKTYKIVPIVIGSTGYIPTTLKMHLQECEIDEDRIKITIPILQRKALRGSVKIVKTAMKLK